MEGEFKKCPNGHYYQGSQCPYCKPTTNTKTNDETTKSTQIYGPTDDTTGTYGTPIGTGSSTGTMGPTGPATKTNTHTPTIPDTPGNSPRPTKNQTMFGEPTDFGENGTNTYRSKRKLVGWLVTYCLDATGMDFKLYEGRNIIGRNAYECNVVINDPRISNVHAVILFRSGKYSIKDNQSSHGTFVNGNDIELEPVYLNDGDIIKIGNTTLKFRSSL